MAGALTFILDFDAVERGVADGLPRRYAWYCAFGILVGLVLPLLADPAAAELSAPVKRGRRRRTHPPVGAARRLGAMSAADLERVTDPAGTAGGALEPPRWAGPAGPGFGSRADLVHRLVQHIADLSADAESLPHRAVPRLGNDLALPDQLRVVVADLVASGAPAELLAEAAAEVTAVRDRL